jgi:hypothetical protein
LYRRTDSVLCRTIEDTMDPDACLIRLLEAIGDNDWDESLHALDDLFQWLSRGGFAPNTQAAAETLRERMRDR